MHIEVFKRFSLILRMIFKGILMVIVLNEVLNELNDIY